MASLTTRISPSAHKVLREMAKVTGKPMQDILDKAIAEYNRTLFWNHVDEAYRNLRKNPKAWKEKLKERAIWERTVLDGLEEA